MSEERKYDRGDVFQITSWPVSGVVGALVYLEHFDEDAIHGYTQNVDFGRRGAAVRWLPMRLLWSDVEYVGTPKFIPEF